MSFSRSGLGSDSDSGLYYNYFHMYQNLFIFLNLQKNNFDYC
jgi:hypothetical protein